MNPVHAIAEDLAQLPAKQFARAHIHCGACRVYHALWPYLRTCRVVGGVEADEPFLGPLLTELIGQQPRHIALAGSADSGVLAMVHRAAAAAGGTGHRYTVVDRCTTPFFACHDFAAAQGFAVQTLHADLVHMPAVAADLIVGHSVMPFLAPGEQRKAALAALRAALARGGRIVLSAKLRPAHVDASAHRQDPQEWAESMLVQVERKLAETGAPLPCPEQELHAMFAQWVALDQFHVAPYDSADSMQRDLEAAGFEVERMVPLGFGVEFLKGGKMDHKTRKGVAAVAVGRP